MDFCVFCQELHQNLNIFYWGGGGLWAARWDNYPVRAGHAEIIPTHHRERMDHLTPEEVATMLPFMQEVKAFIRGVAVSEYDNLASLYRSFWDRRGTLGELSEHLIHKAFIQAQDISTAPDGWTLGMADGEVAGQNVKHVHFHIIPRWHGDVEDPRGHLRRIFPDDPFWQKEIL